jgi:hypothetical protein
MAKDNPAPREAWDALNEGARAGEDMARGHRGHRYFILWGAIWVAMPLIFHYRPPEDWWMVSALAAAGGVISAFIGWREGSRMRSKIDWRFVGAAAALAAFAVLGAMILRPPADAAALYAFICIAFMAGYALAGAWFGYFLYGLGLVLMTVIAVGYFAFHDVFWWWMALGTGVPLILTGLYVRYLWQPRPR